MKVLNSGTLQDAFIRCNEYGHYKVDIILQTGEDVMNFADEIRHILDIGGIPNVDKLTRSGNHIIRIVFKNKSTVEVMPVTSVADIRGIRYHELLYDESVIMSEEVYDILRNRMVPFRSGAYESIDGEPADEKSRLIDTFRKSFNRHAKQMFGEAPVESKELDSFLNSFVINS